MKEEDAIYETYRYTRNKKKINTHNDFVRDSDECAFDYIWKQRSGFNLKFSSIVLNFTLLF